MIYKHFDTLIENCLSSKRIERKINLHFGQLYLLNSAVYELGFKECFEKRYISSYYFDDEILSTARDNIDGVQRRLKFRMRYYSDDFSSYTKEIKIKDGFLGYKNSEKFVEKFSNIKNCLDEAGRYFNLFSNSYLTPVSFVQYTRKYFVHPSGIRCTYDSSIKTWRTSKNGFYQSNNNHFEVIEFKYIPEMDQFFRSQVWPSLSRYSIRGTKSSKYVRSILA